MLSTSHISVYVSVQPIASRSHRGVSLGQGSSLEGYQYSPDGKYIPLGSWYAPIAISVAGLTTRSPSRKHQRKKLACRVGTKREKGSNVAAPMPKMSARMSASV